MSVNFAGLQHPAKYRTIRRQVLSRDNVSYLFYFLEQGRLLLRLDLALSGLLAFYIFWYYKEKRSIISYKLSACLNFKGPVYLVRHKVGK